jgi:MFS family permease
VAAGAAATTQPRRRLGLALAVIATAQLMVVLDSTIVNVALPHIQNALGFSDSNLEWVVNAYTLAFGGLLLLGAAGSSSPASWSSPWPRWPAGSPPTRPGCSPRA